MSMETYTKLFATITDSTIWSEDNETRIVWITMLAMCDQHGYVGASVPGLAKRAVVSVDAVEKALAKFMSPDRHSRSQEFEGRRVEVADRGWLVLNYERFRDMRDEEMRKEYERKRKAAQRAAAKLRAVPDSQGQSGTVPESPESPGLSAHSQAQAPNKNRQREIESPADAGNATVEPLKIVKASKKKPRTSLPEDWQPSEGHRARALERKLDLALEAERFKNHAAATARVCASWDAAFTNWLLSPFAAPEPGRPKGARRDTRGPGQPDTGAFRLEDHIR